MVFLGHQSISLQSLLRFASLQAPKEERLQLVEQSGLEKKENNKETIFWVHFCFLLYFLLQDLLLYTVLMQVFFVHKSTLQQSKGITADINAVCHLKLGTAWNIVGKTCHSLKTNIEWRGPLKSSQITFLQNSSKLLARLMNKQKNSLGFSEHTCQ